MKYIQPFLPKETLLDINILSNLHHISDFKDTEIYHYQSQYHQ